MKRIILCLICMFLLTACSNKNPIVTMNLEDYGTIKMELYPKIAPNTVANFVNLVQDGFYDGNSFHRLVPGFVLQGGDPLGTGKGGPGYSIEGEFSDNGYTNNLTHEKGTVSMARAYDPNSAGSQFFIVLSDKAKSSLDNKYAAFGKVVEGLDTIEKIEDNAEVENQATGKLKENIKIKKATVETFGKTYKVKKYSTNK